MEFMEQIPQTHVGSRQGFAMKVWECQEIYANLLSSEIFSAVLIYYSFNNYFIFEIF